MNNICLHNGFIMPRKKQQGFQPTINNWFQPSIPPSSDTKVEFEFPTHFHLDWPSRTARFMYDKPNKSTFEAVTVWTKQPSTKIKRSDGEYIDVCKYQKELKLTVSGYFPKLETYVFRNTSSIKNTSILKSHLQKNIRRRQVDKAVSTAYALMAEDITAFLRRLPIIMIEDAILHSSITLLVWMMVADEHGWQPGIEQIEWILGIVSYLADLADTDIPGKSDHKFMLEYDLIKLNKLKGTHLADMLFAMQVRRSAGGMRCDIRMLDSHTFVWCDRFQKSDDWDKYLYAEIKDIDIESIKPLCIDDIEIAGVDYHCFPCIIDYVHQHHPDISEDDIRIAIWYNSSGINYKNPLKGQFYPIRKNVDIWNVIEPLVYKKAYYLLRKVK